MVESEWPVIWQNYKKHRRSTIRDWRSGKAKEWSRGDESNAQYNPSGYNSDEAVQKLELDCIRDGTVIRSSAIKKTFYMLMPNIVGLCCGTLTRYVFAEWHQTGAVHGRPICPASLAKMGVHV